MSKNQRLCGKCKEPGHNARTCAASDDDTNVTAPPPPPVSKDQEPDEPRKAEKAKKPKQPKKAKKVEKVGPGRRKTSGPTSKMRGFVLEDAHVSTIETFADLRGLGSNKSAALRDLLSLLDETSLRKLAKKKPA